jgi:hypothetical protein
MPGGDKTGPSGAGPMTGRGAGFCAGYDVPGYMNPTYGRGFGWGRVSGRGFGRGFGMGGGRGWRHWYYATGLPGWACGYSYPYPMPIAPFSTVAAKGEQAGELAFLKDQARYFSEALDDINKRIEELQKNAEKKPEK